MTGPPVWVAELAGRFWAVAGDPPPSPRDLTAAVSAALPVRVVALAGLTLAGVRDWLARSRIPCPTDEPDRPLRACLVARGGGGFIFLDAADPSDEQRFSLAHEVAHFLRDYDAVRTDATRQLGPDVLAVFDGKRPATPDERVQAVFRGVAVAAHVHLLRRDDAGRPKTPAERESESAADRLAFELLAPAAWFTDSADAGAVRERLETECGFPPVEATAYATVLFPQKPDEGFVARLKKSC